MVNPNAIEIISRYIDTNKIIKPMKKWSERIKYDSSKKRPSNLRIIMKQIKDFLILVSGNDVVDMLKDVLTQKELEELTSSKYKEALENLSEHYKEIPLKERHNIMRPLKKASFRYSQVKRLGFQVSKPLWKFCLNSRPRQLGGGQRIPIYLQNLIKEYLTEKSNIASNRLVKNHNSLDENYKKEIPARYLEDNKSELYKGFPYKQHLSKSTFFKYLNMSGQFKKPHRMTDLCEYCEQGKSLKKEIARIVKEEDYEFKESFNINEMIKYFKEKVTT